MRKREMQRIATPVAILFMFIMFYSVTPSTIALGAEIKKNEYRQEIKQVLNTLFEAVKSGDTLALKSLMGEEMYKKNKALIEQNAGYPEYLKDYYRGASFEINNIVQEGEIVVANITIYFPKGRQETMYLNLALSHADRLQNRLISDVSSEATTKRWLLINQVAGAEMKVNQRPVRTEPLGHGGD